MHETVEFLTVPEAAEKLRIGKSTLYLLCNRGDVPHLRIGSSIRIPADRLERWLRERLKDGWTKDLQGMDLAALLSPAATATTRARPGGPRAPAREPGS